MYFSSQDGARRGTRVSAQFQGSQAQTEGSGALDPFSFQGQEPTLSVGYRSGTPAPSKQGIE